MRDDPQKAIDSLGLEIRKVNWFSTYRVHHGVFDRFRRGRCSWPATPPTSTSPAGGQG
jgi:hypothetical protein